MRRIMSVGQPGLGKSTLARAPGARTGLPAVHIDHIHWMPGWVERARREDAAVPCDGDGGGLVLMRATLGNRRAEMLIWLDVPVGRRFARVLWRSLRWHGRNRPDLPADCPEGFHRETLPFWRFIWRTRHASRAGLQRLWDRVPEGKARVRLTRPAEVARFVDGFGDHSALR